MSRKYEPEFKRKIVRLHSYNGYKTPFEARYIA